jgi:hypothetical protein
MTSKEKMNCLSFNLVKNIVIMNCLFSILLIVDYECALILIFFSLVGEFLMHLLVRNSSHFFIVPGLLWKPNIL